MLHTVLGSGHNQVGLYLIFNSFNSENFCLALSGLLSFVTTANEQDTMHESVPMLLYATTVAFPGMLYYLIMFSLSRKKTSFNFRVHCQSQMYLHNAFMLGFKLCMEGMILCCATYN
jgi:hypothetical protein